MSRGLYSLLMYLMVPLFIFRLVRRGFRDRNYWSRWGERFGFSNLAQLQGSVWVHAVSVGEVQAAAPLIRHFLKDKQTPVVVTTMTPTGSQRVRSLFQGQVRHVYAPYDLPDAVHRFLSCIRPVRVIIMETEIWPNMISWCFKRNIPVVLANARLSERSASGYRRIPRLGRLALRRLTRIAAQSHADAERFINLGADRRQIRVTGSIKLDITPPASLREQGAALRRQLGEGRRIWVAASTHAGEEEQVLKAYRAVSHTVPDCLLVLVPRHPERADEVEQVCRRHGFHVLRRSRAGPGSVPRDVYVVDTLGELTGFFAASDLAFIGGSLVPVGGHNMVEASSLGVAVVFGPWLFNFQEISQQLLEHDAARKVENAEDLAATVTTLLGDANLRHEIGQRGRQFVVSNQGALQRLLDLIDEVSPADPAKDSVL